MSCLLLGKISLKKDLSKCHEILPSRFSYKVIVINETKDLKSMRLEELMGSLRTFEIKLNEESKERKKLVGLRVESELPKMKVVNTYSQWLYYQRIL